jgi:hypothetical protein
MVHRGGREPKLDRGREEWTRWIEQEIDEYKAKVSGGYMLLLIYYGTQVKMSQASNVS